MAIRGSWKSERNDNSIVIEVPEPGDTHVEMWIAEPIDGPSAFITPAQAREVAENLIARADAIDPDGAQPARVTNVNSGGGFGVQAHTIHGGVRF